MNLLQRARHALSPPAYPRRQAIKPRRRNVFRITVASALVAGLVVPGGIEPAAVGAAPVGQGFNLNASDLRFILKQIQIAERHVATMTPENPCMTVFGPDADQIPAGGVGETLPWGLRTVSGICNNITADEAAWTYGTADRPFPRMVPPSFSSPAYASSAPAPVMDAEPRLISNLIVDQTATNPAAVAAAGIDPEINGSTLLIPNVAPDVGLSAPYNSWFTLFGQFFDHGLDLVNKGGRGTVMVPLHPTDPLYTPGGPNFMILTRASHDGTASKPAINATSTFVDQSQTYTSHPSHQVFLREYTTDPDGAGPLGPTSTGELITNADHGMATWADLKEQARSVLGIRLVDTDVLRVPEILTDVYGRFIPGPTGLPQMVLANGDLLEGNLAAPITTANSRAAGHAFLDDIAHHGVPGMTQDTDGPGPIQSVPTTPDTNQDTSDDGDVNTYDDEMLDAHYMAGDGRVNENIGLTAVHHVFHAEHNRLVGVIDGMISTLTAQEQAAWSATGVSGWGKGERLFQAARFVTEMEYQHLAFEEFIRKVQPMVNLFGEGGTGYHTDIDPAIFAEFAHAVYRFGHSMLNENVSRTTASGQRRPDVPLFDVFLNPPAFVAGANGRLTPEAAAGEIVRGMTRQVGNELDEFVTDSLRNQLLGLPLDLATLNIARARDTGIPTLNQARRAFFAASGNSALRPYTSWADFGFKLKHQESLVNFIAAYGTHPTIRNSGPDNVSGNADDVTSAAAKRAAAQKIIDDAGSADQSLSAPAIGFLNSTAYDINGSLDSEEATQWVNAAGGISRTGVEKIDLWVGGLAEKQMVFGGLLGPTFNYVFEKQAEALQDGDRFYYLSRTAGLNLLTQLEGNSFSELIMRNTDVTLLPADSFSRPDLVFAVTEGGAMQNDPDTPQNEINEAPTVGGFFRYAGPLHSVWGGQDAADGNNADRFWASEGDDTLRGNGGNDQLEGGDGADNLIGGLGDDILTDEFGDDVIKGGDGNDAISSGQGFGGDLNMGGLGDDFIWGGNDITESFAGPGDDIVFAGDAEDTVFGDDGDDWIDGGTGPFNLLQGDNGAPFQDDPNDPGHDVLVGYGGEQDLDAEGGDDVMLLGPGIQRAEGMLGFDWAIHKRDVTASGAPANGNSDMLITGLLPPSVETNRDRFDLVEALSGWNGNDTLLGDDRTAADLGDTTGVSPEHALNAAGIARIAGLSTILPVGATSFNAGNILVGGLGNDLIQGRGGNDIIDGDAWLDVQLVHDNPAIPGVQGIYEWLDPTLRDAMLSMAINPGHMDIVRTLRTTVDTASADVAIFSGPQADYTFSGTAANLIVTHDGGTGTDGTDTVRNVEFLRFGGATGANVPTSSVVNTNAGPVVNVTAPASGALVRGNVTLTATATDTDGVDTVQFLVDGTEVGAGDDVAPYSVVWASTTSGPHTITAVATDNLGGASTSAPVTITVDNTAPTAAVTSPAAGASVSGTVALAATATDNVAVASVQFRVDNVNVGGADTTAPYTGSWNATAGPHSITAVATDTAGNVTTSPAVAVNGPAGPGPATPNMTAGSDSGISNTDNITNDTTPTFTGTAPAGSSVRLFVDGVGVGTAVTVGAGGTYNITTPVLAPGVRAIRAGNATTATSGALTITIDNAAPTAVALTAPAAGATVSGAAVTVSANATDNVAAGLRVQFRDGATVIGTDTTPPAPFSAVWNTTGVANGTRNLTAVATDAAGNTTTSAVRSVTVSNAVAGPATPDLIAGSDSGVSTTDNITNDTTPTFTGTAAAGSSVRLFVDGVGVGTAVTVGAGGTYSITTPALAQGVRAIRAGNATTATSGTLSITIDTVAPTGAPVIGTAVSGVAGGAVTATANWTPSTNTDVAGYRVLALRVTTAGGAAAATTTSALQSPRTVGSLVMTLGVSGANYQFQVRFVDIAGNNGSLSARSNMVIGR